MSHMPTDPLFIPATICHSFLKAMLLTEWPVSIFLVILVKPWENILRFPSSQPDTMYFKLGLYIIWFIWNNCESLPFSISYRYFWHSFPSKFHKCARGALLWPTKKVSGDNQQTDVLLTILLYYLHYFSRNLLLNQSYPLFNSSSIL